MISSMGQKTVKCFLRIVITLIIFSHQFGCAESSKGSNEFRIMAKMISSQWGLPCFGKFSTTIIQAQKNGRIYFGNFNRGGRIKMESITDPQNDPKYFYLYLYDSGLRDMSLSAGSYKFSGEFDGEDVNGEFAVFENEYFSLGLAEKIEFLRPDNRLLTVYWNKIKDATQYIVKICGIREGLNHCKSSDYISGNYFPFHIDDINYILKDTKDIRISVQAYSFFSGKLILGSTSDAGFRSSTTFSVILNWSDLDAPKSGNIVCAIGCGIGTRRSP